MYRMTSENVIAEKERQLESRNYWSMNEVPRSLLEYISRVFTRLPPNQSRAVFTLFAHIGLSLQIL